MIHEVYLIGEYLTAMTSVVLFISLNINLLLLLYYFSSCDDDWHLFPVPLSHLSKSSTLFAIGCSLIWKINMILPIYSQTINVYFTIDHCQGH